LTGKFRKLSLDKAIRQKAAVWDKSRNSLLAFHWPILLANLSLMITIKKNPSSVMHRIPYGAT
jgi:hypothetical protein